VASVAASGAQTALPAPLIAAAPAVGVGSASASADIDADVPKVRTTYSCLCHAMRTDLQHVAGRRTPSLLTLPVQASQYNARFAFTSATWCL